VGDGANREFIVREEKERTGVIRVNFLVKGGEGGWEDGEG